ncbi:hypothetical protein B7P43_G13538 [Cryptotermes secundus]|uniref:Uncharacterized protein n=1 Tax=Cryptotermes secundus TaxID=105785 RepID=A0A2J7PYV2_9NEOP|nr:hypothetical protein B7P43_G13538 [Cryptotermes secundus]
MREKDSHKYARFINEFLVFSDIDFVLLTARKEACSYGLCPYLTLTLLNL